MEGNATPSITPKKESEIEREFHLLDSICEGLAKTIEELETRINPILRNLPNEKELEEKDEAEPATEVAKEIFRKKNIISNQMRKLKDIIARVEL